MRINETVTYEDATPEKVFALICDEGFRGDVCETMNATNHEVTVQQNGDSTVVTIDRVMPADMPDFVKKITGETVTVEQVETWGPAAGDGARTGDVSIQIKGQPASMSGTTSLRPENGATNLTLEGDVTVTVPFLGRKIEPEVTKAIVSALRTECDEGTERLRGQARA